MRKGDIKRLAFKMWIWRRMERVSWMECRTNEEILQIVEEKGSVRSYTKLTEKMVEPHNEGRLPFKNIIEERMQEKIQEAD